ncbi:MAG TPA: Do family serine endopeptidase [Xanthobacteraceae bacterium]|nr:Do family serine endopeptidase [Xanthobacteraceae bacterium]
MEIDDMIENNSRAPWRRALSRRRLALMGSVAVLGIAVLAGGPGGYFQGTPQAFATTAHSAAAAEEKPAGFADIVEKVTPAVISVRVKIDQDSNQHLTRNEDSPFRRGSPFERFFRQFGMPDMPDGSDMPRGHQAITGEGSGFFISADGYAVTNNHVVDHATSVQVTTNDSKIYTAKVIGTDPKTDLALIKVDGHNDFPFVKFADHNPRIGDWVVAVGNPFGLGGTVTAGIISARGRDIGAGPYDDFIQIDAPVNKGNSGGPSFDVNGNVIGVNTAIFSPSGGSVGIAFAIPADTVKTVVAELKDKGVVTRGWIGVQIQPVTPDIADSLGLKKAEGALVAEPQSGSPAAKAGIEAGDVITAVNGQEIKDARDLARRIGAMSPGTSVNLAVVRKGEQKTFAVTLGELANQQQEARANSNDRSGTAVPHLGLTLAPAGSVAGAGAQGVVVTDVDPSGAAAERGLRTGDVILEVAGKTVSTPAEVRSALQEVVGQGKHSVLMRVKSGDATKFVAVPLGNA